MKRTLALFLLAFLAIHAAICQPPDTLLASQYFEKADSLIGYNNFGEALPFAEKAHSIFIEHLGNDHERVADVLLLMGYCKEVLSRYQEGANDHTEALRIYKKQFGEKHLKTANAYYELGNCERFLPNISSLVSYRKAMDIQEKHGFKNNTALALTYQAIGLIHSFAGKPDSAMYRYKQALAILEKKEGRSGSLIGIYQYVGMMHNRIGDYAQGMVYLQKGMALCLENPEKYKRSMAAFYSDLGVSFFGMEAWEKSLNAFKKANTLMEELGENNTYSYSIVQHHLADSYSKLSQMDSAIYFYKKDLDIQKEIWGSNDLRLKDTHSSIGHCYFLQNKFDDAFYYLNASKIIPARDKVSDIFTDLGFAQYYWKIGDLEKALVYFDSAYNYCSQHKKYKGKKSHFALTYITKVLEKRGQFFLDMANKNDNEEYYKKAKNDFEELISYFDENRFEFSHENSNFAFSAKNKPAFEGAIKANLSLYKKNDEHQYLEAAFQHIEKSKSFTLLKSMHDEKIAKNAGIPNELSTELAELKNKIAFKEQVREKIQSVSPVDTTALQKVNDIIYQLTQTHSQILDKMKMEYPNYYQLKYNLQPTNLQAAKANLLGDDHAILEYFVGEKNIYALVISKNMEEVVEIKRDFPLRNWISQMRGGIFDYFSDRASNTNYQLSEKNYAAHAHLLFQHLIEPIAPLLPKRVTIIPDGEMNYIPFDCLLTSEVAENTSPKDYPYLIHEHLISYAFSAAILKSMKNRVKDKKVTGVLVIAPSFGDTDKYIASADRRSGVGPLRFNMQEAKAVNHLVGGALLLGNEATKHAFLERASQFQILHLSTHGKASDRFGEQPFIVFAEDETDNELPHLYASELNWLGLQADLVVLSACESGLGQLKKGEGIISLARGFLGAGARSTVSTLWAVDDEATMTFMQLFYKNLKSGIPKDEALHFAKLHFIENMPEAHAHPFHWAAFTASGDMSPLQFPTSNWRYLLVLPLLFILLYSARKKRN